MGCGHNYHGDVNIDLFIIPTHHRTLGLSNPHASDVKLTDIPNLIRADCTHLPIKSNTFDMTISNHLIEHVDEPFCMLAEMVRVTKPEGEIHVETPHKLSHSRKWFLHKHSFNLSWFVKAFKVLGLELMESKKNYKYYPHEYLPLVRVPYFIQVTGRVKK